MKFVGLVNNAQDPQNSTTAAKKRRRGKRKT